MKTRHFALLTFFVAMPHAAFGQADDQSMPDTMLAFLKTGMRVGMQTVDGTADVVLSVYDDGQYSLARVLADSRRAFVSAAEFADEYPEVRKQLNAYVEKRAREYPDDELGS